MAILLARSMELLKPGEVRSLIYETIWASAAAVIVVVSCLRVMFSYWRERDRGM